MIGESVFIHPSSVVSGEIHLGNFSSVWPCAVIRADFNRVTIGEYTSIQDNAVIHPTPLNPVSIGNYVTVGHGAVIHGCKIEDEVLVGMNSTVLDGAVVGRGSIIGANTLVRENTIVPENSLIVGVPGKIIEGKGNSKLNRMNALLYFELAKKYIRGDKKMSAEEFISLMQNFSQNEE